MNNFWINLEIFELKMRVSGLAGSIARAANVIELISSHIVSLIFLSVAY